MEQPSQTLLSEYFNTASMKANQKAGRSALGILSKCYSHHGSSDACHFSSSLPDLSHERYFGIRACSIYDTTSKSNELDKDIAIKDSFGDLDLQGVGKLLPDEGELFDGIMNDFNQAQYSNQVEQLEDCDLFNSGGEHPSRTLFVRSIDSNVDDSELRSLFEDNPSEKDMNQGTLVVFNLDPSISIDKLHQIFGVFGEVKEIRETPNKRHHKFIEYYDVRAAENALRSLNNCDIAGSIIKLEPSRPGGVRRNLKQQHLSLELEHDALRNYRHQVSSPLINSPPGNWSQFSSSVDDCSFRNYGHSSTLGSGSPINSKHLFPPRLSNSLKVGPIGKEQNRTTRSSLMFSKPENAIQLLSHSFQRMVVH
ncbi:hypothetical protein HPP92_008028 [Vanilla planifolia]|uniref:RRM domain-containing protein n=1 Tax=Vanilla planifolia TaxID=51239 RepID=A0A835V8C7_VANPL|nr:hypothetical protein HPP92_008028 [Vanilla planifolia]